MRCDYPQRHWELDGDDLPTNKILDRRRPAKHILPIPKPKRTRTGQQELVLDEGKGVSTEDQQYDPTALINEVRRRIDRWRELPASQWRVTPETARLLGHWRHYQFSDIRPFFCQVEAVETLIWLAEVAPGLGREGRIFLVIRTE